jgi:basic amino acid/polyamine antiporter, APA family
MSIFRPILKKREFHLKKSLRLFETTMVGVGFIVGAGIYVLIGAIAGYSGSAIWLSFLLAGIAALTSGLSYAELSSIFPTNESEYEYAKEGINKSFGFFAYISIILALTIGIAGVSLGFASYFSELTGITNTTLIAIGIILIFSLLNWYSTNISSKVNAFCTVASILGLLIIVFLALFNGSTTTPNFLEMPKGLIGVIQGASLIFFAFLGFEGIVKLSDETKNARKTIPLAIILAITISTILYLIIAIVSVSILPWNVLANSQAPLADVAASVLGNKAFFALAIIALFSTSNTILMGIFSGSRGFYGIGTIFKKFKSISQIGKRNTPTRAIILTTIIAMLFLAFNDISMIIGFTNVLVFLTFIIINISVIRLRYLKPNIKRKFKIPLSIKKIPIFPVFGIIIAILLLFNLQIIHIISGLIISSLIFISYKLINLKGVTKNGTKK